jgi:hypothetical protein
MVIGAQAGGWEARQGEHFIASQRWTNWLWMTFLCVSLHLSLLHTGPSCEKCLAGAGR